MVSARLCNTSRGVSWALAVAGVLLVGYAGLVFDDLTPFPGVATLVPVAGALCLLAAGEARVGNPISRLLALRPAQSLGDLSYSWYLWHWPFIVFALALWPTTSRVGAVAAVLSLVPAWLSYRFVEGPIRFARSPGTQRTLVLAAACIMLPMASAVALSAMHRAILETDAISELSYSLRQHSECGDARPLSNLAGTDCAPVAADQPIADAVLIGDSNARHFGEAFVRAAHDAGVPATVSWLNNCPFVDLETIADGDRNDRCRSFVTDSMNSLIDERPELVAIASSSDTYMQSTEFEFLDPTTGQVGSSTGEKSVLWAEGLSRVVERLTAEGIGVVIVHPVPKFVGWDPRECSVLGLLLDEQSCSRVQERDVVDEFREPAVTAESDVAAVTGATTLEVTDLLCPDGFCSTYRDHIWVWRDGTHISVDESIRLTPAFADLF